MKLDRNDQPSFLRPCRVECERQRPDTPTGLMKSAQSPSPTGGVWDWGNRAQDPRNASAFSAGAKSAAGVESGRDGAALLERNERDERVGLFLAGALLAVLAWGTRGVEPRSAALIIAMFAGAYMIAAFIGEFGRRRNPRIRRVIDVSPCREPRHAGVAFRGARVSQRIRDAIDVARPIGSANEAPPGLGISSKLRGRSAYDGLADE